MKLFLASVFLAFVHISCAQSEGGSDILSLAIEKLPPCALQCTLSTVGASSCELTDFDCIKHNEKLLGDLSACVKSSCRIRDALTAKNFLAEMMNTPVRNKTEYGTFTTLIVGGFAVLAYILRVFARLPMFGRTWGLDDWVMTATIIIVIPLTICAYLLNELGLGRDMWMVPFDNITKILEIFYFTELLYLTSIALTKISVLLFYLRIFPDRNLRKWIYAAIGMCIIYIVTFVTVTALQCIPIRIAWEHWDGEHHGKCINLNAIAWSSAGINIILDLIIICLPLREIKNLSMTTLRKVAIMVMFLGGLFITIVSMLRLKYMVQFAHTENVTWDYLPVGIWSAVEAHVGVIVACLPAIRSLETSFRQRYFPRNTTTSTSYYAGGSAISGKKKTGKSSGSRTWPSNNEAGSDTFVRLNDYELSERGKEQRKNDTADTSPSLGSRTETLSPTSDLRPLTQALGPEGFSNIRVQKDFTVVRNPRPLHDDTSEEDLVGKDRFRY